MKKHLDPSDAPRLQLEIKVSNFKVSEMTFDIDFLENLQNSVSNFSVATSSITGVPVVNWNWDWASWA